MQLTNKYTILIFLAVYNFFACSVLGQNYPDEYSKGHDRPGKCCSKIFLPGKISLAGRKEGNLSHSSLNKTYIYRVYDKGLEDPLKLITYTKKGKCEIIAENIGIDSEYREWDFNFNRRGDRFYFTSDRPVVINGDTASNSNIWVTDYNNGKWGSPEPLAIPVNVVDSYSGYPAFTDRNELYFHSKRSNGWGGDDIYYCIEHGKEYKELRLLDYPVNTVYNDRDPAISPDGRIMAFFSDRPGASFADGDLFMVFKDDAGLWSEPVALGYLVGYAGHPYIDDAGEFLYYTGLSGSDSDIFRVEISSLMQHIRPYIKLQAAKGGLFKLTLSTSENEVPIAYSDESAALIFSRTPQGFTDWENEPVYYTIEDNGSHNDCFRLKNHNSSWITHLPGTISFKRMAVPVWIKQESGINIDIKIHDFNNRASGTIPGYPLNTSFIDSWPSIDFSGNLYFFSNRPGGNGDLDLYFSALKKNTCRTVTNPAYPINTRWREHDPAVSPDGAFLVFASDRPGGFGGDDLYICYRLDSGEWSVPFNLGTGINTEFDENRAVLGSNAKSLYFSSNRSGDYDIYFIGVR